MTTTRTPPPHAEQDYEQKQRRIAPVAAIKASDRACLFPSDDFTSSNAFIPGNADTLPHAQIKIFKQQFYLLLQLM
jgi:hypothetical protein